MNAQQPNHFNALVAHAMKYLKGMTVQCSKVRNAHIASMTAQQVFCIMIGAPVSHVEDQVEAIVAFIPLPLLPHTA